MSARPELAGQTVGLELGASIAAFDATDFERLGSWAARRRTGHSGVS